MEFILVITQTQICISEHEKEIAHENMQEWKK